MIAQPLPCGRGSVRVCSRSRRCRCWAKVRCVSRPRIDLNGVPLVNADKPDGATILIFRYRTTDGLIVLIPESADELIPWASVEAASLDLASGRVQGRVEPAFAQAHPWMRGAVRLEGQWTDRLAMTAEDVGDSAR